MARDAAASVAALAAAGEDVSALADAVERAGFLDAVPGEDRQKLRAARTRLRKLLAAAKEGASASAAERSPHAKSAYDAAEFDALADMFESLKWRLLSKPGGATVKSDPFYALHGLAQQARVGDNDSERPVWSATGGLDYEGRARWDAWAALKGVSSDDARARFVALFYEFPPSALYADTRGSVSA